jgi:hypothetical protein
LTAAGAAYDEVRGNALTFPDMLVLVLDTVEQQLHRARTQFANGNVDG